MANEKMDWIKVFKRETVFKPKEKKEKGKQKGIYEGPRKPPGHYSYKPGERFKDELQVMKYQKENPKPWPVPSREEISKRLERIYK